MKRNWMFEALETSVSSIVKVYLQTCLSAATETYGFRNCVCIKAVKSVKTEGGPHRCVFGPAVRIKPFLQNEILQRASYNINTETHFKMDELSL